MTTPRGFVLIVLDDDSAIRCHPSAWPALLDAMKAPTADIITVPRYEGRGALVRLDAIQAVIDVHASELDTAPEREPWQN